MMIAALALGAVLVAAPATEPESQFQAGMTNRAESRREQARRRELAVQLAERGDAESLATAAMILETLNDRTAALEHVRRAAQAAPERADLAWLELNLCVETPSCSSGRPAERLAALDPQNGYAYLHELPTAPGAQAAEVTAALLTISQAERFDIYWPQLAISTHDALARSERADSQRSDARYSTLVEALGLIAATGLPSRFQQLLSACRGEAIEDSTRRDQCLRIARALQRGDTLLSESIGLAVEQKLWPADSREAAAIEARRRELRQRQEALSKLEASGALEDRMTAALRVHRTEREAGDALLAELGDIGQTSATQRDYSSLSTATVDPLTDAATTVRSAAPRADSHSRRTTMPIELLNVNFLAVTVAALSSFLLGGLWYSRALFGAVWSREAGVNPDKQGHRPMVFVTSYLLAFLAAWLFAALLPADISVAQATVLGALIGIVWVATSFGINYGFGDRSLTLWLIDGGYHTLQFTLYGAIIGVWR